MRRNRAAPAALVIPCPGPGRQARRNLGRGLPNGRFATPRDDGSTVDLLFVFEPVPHHLYPVGGRFPRLAKNWVQSWPFLFRLR